MLTEIRLVLPNEIHQKAWCYRTSRGEQEKTWKYLGCGLAIKPSFAVKSQGARTKAVWRTLAVFHGWSHVITAHGLCTRTPQNHPSHKSKHLLIVYPSLWDVQGLHKEKLILDQSHTRILQESGCCCFGQLAKSSHEHVGPGCKGYGERCYTNILNIGQK